MAVQEVAVDPETVGMITDDHGPRVIETWTDRLKIFPNLIIKMIQRREKLILILYSKSL